MKELSAFNPISLSEKRKLELEQLMADTFFVSRQAATELLGFANVRQLRAKYKQQLQSGKNVLWFNPKARKLIDQLTECESEIISGYIRLAHRIASAFSKNYKISLTYEDYLQEASLGIYDAMYLYDGRNRFSTYAYWIMKNRLLVLIKRELAENGITARVLKIKALVEAYMNQGHSLDRSFSRVQEDGVELTETLVERVRTLLGQGGDPENQFAASVEDFEGNQELLKMRKAVELTELTDIERKLINAHLDNDTTFRKQFVETQINPSTGRLWTKQALSQHFLRACQKIQATYSSDEFSRVA
jgi:RNA polymerase sigma factor (sigma-70 family)